MKGEIDQAKGARIYCIYFENKEYNCFSEDPRDTLQKISELGGTGIYKIYDSLNTLVSVLKIYQRQ